MTEGEGIDINMNTRESGRSKLKINKKRRLKIYKVLKSRKILSQIVFINK